MAQNAVSQEYSTSTTNLADKGTYTFTLTATLDDFFGTFDSSLTFDLLLVDVCEASTILEQPLPDLYGFLADPDPMKVLDQPFEEY